MTRSPQRLKEQVKEVVSELPIHAARLAVMGVGRALLLTDRVRRDYREAREAGLGPVLGRLRDDAGNLLGKVTSRPAPPPAEPEIVVGKPTPPTAEPEPELAAAKPKPVPEALPVPDYDEATLASVRARLRNLDAEQIAVLREYERAHAARANFLRMFENRIAKLKEAEAQTRSGR